MRPYLAIIKDSFREALASRVLWVLLLIITALLLALAPIHWRSTIAAEMTSQDIRSIRNISNALKVGGNPEAPPLIAYVWNSLSKRTRERISELNNPNHPRAFATRDELAADFNRIIQREDFYQEELWADAKLNSRAEELLADGNLNGDSLKQFNRLALEAALPGQLRPCPDEAVMFRYAKWDIDFVPPFSRKFAIEMMDTFVMAFMAIFVGFFGIFAAVLVTASIMPNMLNSGSLHVLLSKPISRPLLFLAKFLGGCSFVFINAAYLIVGLWLILQFRFGVSKPQLLWSIPIFVFTFAIFYSVSALAGLVWRSTVMAIVATIGFWIACKSVTSTKDVLEQFVIVPRKISNIVPDGDGVFVTRQNGDVAVWNSATRTLDPIFESNNPDNDGPPMMMGRSSNFAGMLYDQENEMLIALERKWSQAELISGSKESGWRRESSTPAPTNSRGLFLHEGRLLAVADGGVYQVSTDGVARKQDGINIFGLKLPAPSTDELHQKISEDLGPLPADARVAYDSSTGTIYVHGSRRLRAIREQEGVFRQVHITEVELKEVTDIAAGGGIVAIAHRDEEQIKLKIFDADTLQAKPDAETNNQTDLRKFGVSRDGRWVACLFENEELIMYDLESGDTPRAVKSLPSQGSITGFHFDDGSMLIANGNDQVLTLSLPDLNRVSTLRPDLPFIRKLFRYLIKPLYLISPKPAELQNTMQYALTRKDTVKIEGPGMGPGGRTIKLNPWQPLMSNSIFIGLMLLIGCAYVFWQDF